MRTSITEFVEENCDLEIQYFSTHEERLVAMEMMNLEIESGLSWPFEEEFPDFASFSRYFMSHSAFVARVKNFKEKSVEFLRNMFSKILLEQRRNCQACF